MASSLNAKLLRWLCDREEGQTLVEYGLLVGLIALAAIGGLTALGTGTGGLYDVCRSVADTMSAVLT